MSCCLCKKPSQLRNSHVISEFLYESMYDEKHRFHVLSIDPTQANRLEQKGLREELLCDSCEQHLSKWEDYAKKLLKGGIGLTVKSEGNLLHISEIDYKKFKLFQLSILWRASISKLPFFKNISLGSHEENVRSMLFSDNPGETNDYGSIMFGLKANGAVLADIMTPPIKTKLDGHSTYRFIFGGFAWVYLVSSHKKPPLMAKTFLQTSGDAYVLVKDAHEIEDIQNFGRELMRLWRI